MSNIVNLSVMRGRKGKPHIFKFDQVWVQLSFSRANGVPTGSINASSTLTGSYEATNPTGTMMVTNYLQERGLLQRMVNMVGERTP